MLVAILLVAAGLRGLAVARANMGLDEDWTLELSTGRGTMHEHLPVDTVMQSPPDLTSLSGARPWWTVWTTLNEVTHPPLFYLVLRLWRELSGGGTLAARLLPCAASLAAIMLLYRAVRMLHGPAPALWACALMALAGQQIFYAKELRNYSFTLAMGLGACAAMATIERKGATAKRLALLAIWVLAMALSHYCAMGGIAALGLYAAIRLRGDGRKKTLLAMSLALAVFLLVWGPFFLKQRHAFELGQMTTDFLRDEHPKGHAARVLGKLALIPAAYLSPPEAHTKWPLLLIAATAAVPVLFPRRSRDLLLWYLWLACTLGLLTAQDLLGSTLMVGYSRYALFGSPALFSLLAAGFAGAPAALRHVVPGAAALACVTLLPSALAVQHDRKDWRQVAAWVNQYARPGDPLVVTGHSLQPRWNYLKLMPYLPPGRNPVVILPGPAGPPTLAFLRSASHVWVIAGLERESPNRFQGGQFHQIRALEAGAAFGEVVFLPHAR